ncbi:DUF305 domain-containing protein [Actinocorallia longicatena]|uniref:DUF305 domain-containing protein n=1 Tax=Actinocorallia longicatena TaxID=111803 RepID=A0ABP6QE54_9ACTN
MRGRVFSAIGFVVIGAVLALLLTGIGSAPGADPAPAAAPAAGPVDIGFAQDMVVHHQQAVTMAQAVIGRASPSVSRLAVSIELNQLKQIGQLQGWLDLWNAPQVPSGPPMTWMAGHKGGHAGPAVMPGTAAQKDIDRLGELHGRALDAWFLKLMIRHHQGGLLMTAAAAQHATIPQVRRLATVMGVAQGDETAVMSGLLGARKAG